MRGFGYTSEQADKVSDNLKAVLEYTLATEKEDYEEMIAEHGEDSPLLEGHIWYKAFDLLVDLELD